MLPLDGAPEAFDEGVIGGAAAPIAADATAGGQQGLLESGARKLAALVGVKNIRCRGLA